MTSVGRTSESHRTVFFFFFDIIIIDAISTLSITRAGFRLGKRHKRVIRIQIALS